MMPPIILWLLICLSVSYVSSDSSEANMKNEGVADNVELNANNFNDVVDESKNPSESDNVIHVKTATDNNNLQDTLGTEQNRLYAQVQANDVDKTNGLKNTGSNLKPVNGVYDFTNPLNQRNAHKLKWVSKPVDVRSPVNRNGHYPYEDESSLSALLGLYRIGGRTDHAGRPGLNILARNGISSTDNSNRLRNMNDQNDNEMNRYGGNKMSNVNQVDVNRYFLNLLRDRYSSDPTVLNHRDGVSHDFLKDKSKQVVIASLNKLKEDSRLGLIKPVRIVKKQLVGRSGSGLDKDNLLNAIERHNNGEINALSALASISNLKDDKDIDSNSFVNKNDAVKATDVESESDNFTELNDVNTVSKTSINEAEGFESGSYLQSEYPEEKLSAVPNRRSGTTNNQLLNNVRFTNGKNRGLDRATPNLLFNRPVPIDPYNQYNDISLNTYNQRGNVGVFPNGTRGRNGLIENGNIIAKELIAGVTLEGDRNNIDENELMKSSDFDDDVDTKLKSFDNDLFNALPLENELSVINALKDIQEDVNGYDNVVVLLDAKDIDDLNQVKIDILSGRRILIPLKILNSHTDTDDVLSNVYNLNNRGRRRNYRDKNDNVDSAHVESNNHSAHNKAGKLNRILRLINESELTLDEARQLVSHILKFMNSMKRHI